MIGNEAVKAQCEAFADEMKSTSMDDRCSCGGWRGRSGPVDNRYSCGLVWRADNGIGAAAQPRIGAAVQARRERDSPESCPAIERARGVSAPTAASVPQRAARCPSPRPCATSARPPRGRDARRAAAAAEARRAARGNRRRGAARGARRLPSRRRARSARPLPRRSARIARPPSGCCARSAHARSRSSRRALAALRSKQAHGDTGDILALQLVLT